MSVHEVQSRSEVSIEDVLQFASVLNNREVNSPWDLERLIETYDSNFKASAKNSGSTSLEKRLVDHHREFLKPLNEEATYNTYRRQSLARDLSKRGLSVRPENAAEALAMQSRENMLRLLRSHGLNENYRLDHEISAMVKKLRFEITHNRSRLVTTRGEFLLSSHQIRRYGLPGGMNSMQDFNTDFMQNDDNVFFFLSLATDKTEKRPRRSEYGTKTVFLDDEFALKYAWVSPYVMRAADLAAFGETFLRGRYQDEDLSTQVGVSRDGRYTSTPVAEALRNQLHLFDFTLPDLQKLFELQLGHSLLALKKSHDLLPAANNFAEVKQILEGNDEIAIDTVYQTLIFKPLGFGLLELKVPVAVPTRFLNEI